MGVVGSNPDEVDALARTLERSARRIDSMYMDVLLMIRRSGWKGPAATQFENRWRHEGQRRMNGAVDILYRASRSASANAQAQRQASSASSGAFGGGGARNVGGGYANVNPGRDVGTTPCYASGRDAVSAALSGVNETEQNEIQIRKLDNGKVVVVLPGVVDLTSGLKKGAGAPMEWMAPNNSNSVRDMSHAIPEGVMPNPQGNPYAIRVKEAMQAAGVPAGADVMLVGQSYGAYTAAGLAADPAFNDAWGTNGAGYHVNVTHVVAAGAATDPYLMAIPPRTHALVLNNNWDAAYRIEEGLVPNFGPQNPNQLEINFNGGGKGWGHDPQNYTSWLDQSTDRKDLSEWLETAADYGESGTKVNYKVPDVR